MRHRTFAAARLSATAATATALTGLLALSACSSSSSPTTSSAPPSDGFSATLLSPIPASSTPPASTSPAAPSSTASSTPVPPKPKPTPTGPAACTSTQLKIGALRGSAAAGQEFALLTFTNVGSASCTLFGFPGASLRLNNKLLGQAAQRSKVTPRSVTLAPGKQAQATLTDFSSCQAPVSDTVRVYAPNLRQFVDLPLTLRGCRVVVDPVKPG